MLSDDSPDEDIAIAFVKRKGLSREWIGIAWLAIQDARRRFDPSRGSWLTCARIGMAGAFSNTRDRARYRREHEVYGETIDIVGTCGNVTAGLEMRDVLACCDHPDAAIVGMLAAGSTLEWIGNSLGYNKQWACRRLKKLRARVKHQSSIERRGPLPLACRGGRAKNARRS